MGVMWGSQGKEPIYKEVKVQKWLAQNVLCG